MARRHELTDTQWEAIQEFLPGKDTDPGRTAVDSRWHEGTDRSR
jgi:hypothetical protein